MKIQLFISSVLSKVKRVSVASAKASLDEAKQPLKFGGGIKLGKSKATKKLGCDGCDGCYYRTPPKDVFKTQKAEQILAKAKQPLKHNKVLSATQAQSGRKPKGCGGGCGGHDGGCGGC